MVRANEAFHTRQIIKSDIFEAIFACFEANGPARNLLNSAVIALCQELRTHNDHALVAHVVTRHGAKFADITYVDTFQLLRIKHEQNEEGAQQSTSASRSMQTGMFVTFVYSCFVFTCVLCCRFRGHTAQV